MNLSVLESDPFPISPDESKDNTLNMPLLDKLRYRIALHRMSKKILIVPVKILKRLI